MPLSAWNLFTKKVFEDGVKKHGKGNYTFQQALGDAGKLKRSMSDDEYQKQTASLTKGQVMTVKPKSKSKPKKMSKQLKVKKMRKTQKVKKGKKTKKNKSRKNSKSNKCVKECKKLCKKVSKA